MSVKSLVTQKRDSTLESLLYSEHIVIVEKMAVGGSAVSRIPVAEKSVVVFIPYGAPNDQLKIKISAVEKNFLTGEIIEIISPSTHRRQAPCEYFGRCGGCLWQHIDENQQILQKEQLLQDLFKKFIPSAEYALLPTIATAEKLGYRNRIQLKQLGQKVGYFKHQSHDIVEINNCLISEPALQNYIPLFKSQLRSSDRLKKFELKITQAGIVEDHAVGEFGEGLAFSQVNRFVNEKLVQTVVSLVQKKNPKYLTELYAGSGNFTFPMSQKLPQMILQAVELSPQLTKIAVERIKLEKKHKQITFFTTKAETFCKMSSDLSSEFVLLDPPRAGVDSMVVSVLIEQKPQTILYISCNAVNLARDLQKLVNHYKVSHLQIFDMFPQTDHFETVCLLDRIDNSFAT